MEPIETSRLLKPLSDSEMKKVVGDKTDRAMKQAIALVRRLPYAGFLS